jgi:hypothetical protein
VLDIAARIAGTRWGDELLRADVEWIESIASFSAGVRGLTFPATEQEHRLRALMAAAPARAEDLATMGDPRLALGAQMTAARRSSIFTRFDGNLAELVVPSPVTTSTSATRLERWATCPFAYFTQDVLGVEEVENPEESLQISPLDWGTLVHEALERFVLEVLDRPTGDQPTPDEPWTDRDHARLRAIGEDVCAAFEARGLTGRPVFGTVIGVGSSVTSSDSS